MVDNLGVAISTSFLYLFISASCVPTCLVLLLVRWLNKIIVTERIKAPFLVQRFFMMYLLILEGVPSRHTHVRPIMGKIIKWLPLKLQLMF